MSHKFNVFISHSHQDREWTRKLSEALKQRGLSVWLDEDQIRPGEEWGQRILEGLQKSSHIVFLIGPGASLSKSLALELGMALAERKPIIPVVDKDVSSEDIPGPIRRRQYLKKNDPQAVADEIVEAVAA
jgi:hypothetical protein